MLTQKVKPITSRRYTDWNKLLPPPNWQRFQTRHTKRNKENKQTQEVGRPD